jgi:calcineurin-like phosphoesterase family protein
MTGVVGPRRPRSLKPAELGFVLKPMVRWLDPRQLVITSLRAVISGMFGAWADKRELQAALTATGVGDESRARAVWIDYVADLGDGWQSTYTIARFLAGRRLDLAGEQQLHRTERGRILVLGGDEVYPTASVEEYENRFLGPYRAALPMILDADPPLLFAVPGNHDWYDGLTSFMRVFCQGKWIGGWKTSQTRSYFAVKLPHHWWIWGIDIQLDTYVDDPQLHYFKDVVCRDVEPGDTIILCTAIPAWAHVGRPGDDPSFRNLDYFERNVIQPTGARVMLYLSGDWHHYCRYAPEPGFPQRITSGGGGAFLYPTQDLPEWIELEEAGQSSRYRRKKTYPTAEDSKQLRRRLWLLPIRNVPFGTLVGGTYLLLAWLVLAGLARAGLGHEISAGTLQPSDLGTGLSQSVLGILLLVLLVRAFVGFAKDLRGARRWAVGIAHSLGHLAALSVLMLGGCRITSHLRGATATFAFLGLVGAGGAIAGSLVMAAYLNVSNRFLRIHNNETYSAMGIEDYKNFLRLHIDESGSLTIFPIGVQRVCRRWRVRPDAPLDAPWFEPAGDPPKAHLIEEPIRIGVRGC